MSLKIGTKAPDFTLPSTSGSDFKLSDDMNGKPCVIYFYPKDFTPGCTKEACSFRDSHQVFGSLGIEVFGISKDGIETHKKFKASQNLPFELLADVSGEVCKSYKALVPLLGMPKRVTYLLDAEHKIVSVYDSMFDSLGHIKKMIEKLKEGTA
ncbi:peroxiredoxin [Flammeovirgaceae bacterium SG7u.111]|nr:peroxiredoxin [Flammeovirgaceae bacterium SG7u.132]WPO37948.1 peroxiredoxin [Flammeovirgaceae bacterium SG7u.111]